MAGRKTQPFKFNPRSVADALDGGQTNPGAMMTAINLIFDPANLFTLQCRPAAIKTFDFTGITGAGAVSVAFTVGDICYGMIKSDTVATYDQPFAYNLATNSLVTVSGTQSSSTLPLTQPTTGTWSPPTMDLVGVLLYVTHPGFVGGGSAFFGWFDTTNPAAPVWHAGNTTTTLLPHVPQAVAQFNNRAWFAVRDALYVTDALTTAISDATHIILIDGGEITGLITQPMSTTTQGTLQALVVFTEGTIDQITGDFSDGTLVKNLIDDSVGCNSPRTLAATPKGVMFRAIDGLRIVSSSGSLEEPNPDLKLPFINTLDPTRASGCYVNNIYRITVKNGHANGNPLEEYWYDFRSAGWTGPHTFTQSMALDGGGTTIVFSNTNAPGLYTSDVVVTGNSIFTELGDDLSFLLTTSPLPDNGGLYENSCVLTVIDMQLPTDGSSYTFSASDVLHGVQSTATVTANINGTIWNAFAWGNANWTAVSYGMERYNIPWKNPVVFSRMILQATGVSNSAFKIGKSTIGYEQLRYVRTV